MGDTALGGALAEALGLHLDTEHAIDHHEGGLDHAQRSYGVGQEAQVTRGVDEVEAEAFALDVGETGREAELTSLLVVVVI